MGAVVAGSVTVTHLSYAGTKDMYDTYDAIAVAKKIPNDQGPDPECAGTPVTPAAAASLSAALNARTSARSHQGARAGESGTGHAGHGAVPPGGPQADRQVPSACHADLGGPSAQDFVDIRQVQPNVRQPRAGRTASMGTFTVNCGVDAEGRHNSDNVIVAPGVVNGAHHVHDYVGNDSTSGASTDQSLAAAGTTCDGGDLSTYYWPVLRRIGTVGSDANKDGGGKDGNVGKILTASSAQIVYRGSPQSKVVAMPRFLRIITGDAKAFTNGPANANAKWSCTGFENRVTTKYPLCPKGSKVLRIADFQSCWDGKNTDSANHRSHIVFQLPDNSGRCPKNTVAVPQLTIKLAYDVPPGRSFALDGFPEQKHNPITDHNDFINVMPDTLMATAVKCINSGQQCNAGQFGAAQSGAAVAQTVNCPSVADKVPPVPAAAQAEVSKELANLDKEINETNARLAKQAAKPEGGPNFVQNAILGPLKDKRVAVLDRIAIDIGRVTGSKPDGLQALAPCTFNK